MSIPTNTSVTRELDPSSDPKKLQDSDPPTSVLLDTKTYILILSFVQGLFDICNLAIFYYQKIDFDLEPSFIQAVDGIINIPWCIKPLFGFAVDKIIKKFGRSKYIIIVSSIIRAVGYGILAKYKIGIWSFYIIGEIQNMCYLFENIVIEYTIVLLTQKSNRSEMNFKDNKMPYYYGSRAFGSLIGLFFGGRLMHNYGMSSCFFVAALLPFATILLAVLYREEIVTVHSQRSIRAEVVLIKNLLSQDKVIMMIVFIMLVNLTPMFETMIAFYLTDYLDFTPEDLANFNSFAAICYIASLVLYSNYFIKLNPQTFYCITNVLLWGTNISLLLVLTKTLDRLGIDNKIFCFLSQGAHTLIAEINFMPILAVWICLVPKDLEATSITLFSGLINLSNVLACYLGSLILWVMRVNKTNFDDMWKPIVVQNTYLLVIILTLSFVPFPEAIAGRDKDGSENGNCKDEESTKNEELVD